jgi:biopolymer transport protein ExbD
MSQTKRRKKFGRGRSVNEEMTLQITSMADVFTIILVFILKSSSMGVSNVSVSNGTKLPSAVHSEAMVEKLKLEISPDAVILDGAPVAKLAQLRFEGADLESDGTSRSLNTALIAQRQKREPASEAATPAEQDRMLLLLADERTPYATLRTVMDSAANQGFARFKLVVVEDK